MFININLTFILCVVYLREYQGKIFTRGKVYNYSFNERKIIQLTFVYFIYLLLLQKGS